MQYTLLITGSPYQTKACHSALRFIKAALLEYPNSIKGVFFYEDAVLIGNQIAQPPRDEINITQAWQDIAQQHNIPLYLCIAAAVRRGIINDTESRRYELEQHTLAEGFQLEGLGTFVDLMNTTNKVIQFR
ncbi:MULTISPECIES: sulfurtransferase complex subunit TusD [Marinomonas]|uniref:Sulfurtransferase complex subunit TusD n=1 Tax=Marinomonas arctica TaxID=383750 RepID=A0A7H1J2Y3_9GAMM|nr:MULTISPECIES: sulfurtransferase complex subunit TusD [Marinomonas]MCS7486564.1 sulfur relay protein TusD [Marinomonas sp. BSi20414]QNT04849.1 sulfurtransferase complex subunit TusD [Marinomonas arctica]GGN31265.1 sulfurtransferase TusD [Marinomonas arctica]